MKRCIIILLLTLIVPLGYCPEVKEKVKDPLKSTLYAIIEQESRWNTKIINYKEVALGALQIRKCIIDDVNYHYNVKYNHADMFELNQAIEVFWLYQNIYHNTLTPEIMARTWVGGPNGIRKKSSINYWNEVKRRMKKYE